MGSLQSHFRLAYLCFALVLEAGSAVAQVQPSNHPNHYVILVDSSFSTVSSSTKSRAYHKLLHEELPRFLYSEGFGDVPRLAPMEDVVSVLDFGIVTDNYSPEEAYSVLSRFRFQDQFIHPVLVRRGGLTRDSLQQYLTPRQFYRLTVGSWAPQLAVRFLGDSASENVADRTFLILITDGELNGNSSRDEIANARRKGDPEDTEAVRSFLQEFSHSYSFLGKEVDGATFSRKYDATTGDENPACGEDCFYIETYEIVPAKWLEWQNRGAGIVPLGNLRTSYRRKGSQIEVSIRGEESSQLETWLQKAPDMEQGESRWSAAGGTTSTLRTDQGSQLEVALPAPLSCGALSFQLSVSGTLRQKDHYLGARTTEFSFAQPTVSEEPDWCRTAHFVKIASMFVIGGLLLAFGGWYGYNRFWADHIRVILPGLLGPLTLTRKGVFAVGLLVPPDLEVPALELELPSRLYQALFCSGTRLKICGETAKFARWLHNQSLEFRLPYHAQPRGTPQDETVAAVWRLLPSGPAALLLEINDGRHTGTLKITFSHRWNSSNGAVHE